MKIISHRGNGYGYPENSEKAILSALDSDICDGVEIDVRMTKDKRFVLCHDPFYKGKLIALTNFKNLMGITELEQLLMILNEQNNKKIIMLDIKEEMKNYKTIANVLINVLKKYQLSLYVCSFNYDLMNFLVSRFIFDKSNILFGLIISDSINNQKIKNKFDFNSLKYTMVSSVKNKLFFIWTVNNIKQLKKIPRRSNIITDNPYLVYNFFKMN